MKTLKNYVIIIHYLIIICNHYSLSVAGGVVSSFSLIKIRNKSLIDVYLRTWTGLNGG